ncbi:MAG: Smr/MutS family protein [Candidatus Latescibacteria bacterium]|jgi:DNA-nicking Smr family endonuclease|nr:Smr/MutS family protein [Candidatus Latescibacterota bacterium]MBT4140076.1 Smr/MutS family protein [Candidatus Latescibacterota bacterium]
MSNPIEIPINGELDLHTFHPRDIKTLVPDYLDECKERGILDVRIIHGKGTGALRETVHAILEKRTDVAKFYLTDHNWGSTSLTLKSDA